MKIKELLSAINLLEPIETLTKFAKVGIAFMKLATDNKGEITITVGRSPTGAFRVVSHRNFMHHAQNLETEMNNYFKE